ncbi:MAG: hypothetical protein QHH30_01075 [candidate division NC10 bacterium]|nr:hypothetical protein [candidate division NC10 bacterium]
MKIISVFHPLFQCASFGVGVYNARMGLTRRGFTYARHLSFGLLYYGMTTLGLIGGWLVNGSLRQAGVVMKLRSHLEVAILMVLLFLLAGVLGLLIRYRPLLRKALLPIHKYLNLASLLLFIYQGVTGFSALFGSFLS